MPIVIENPVLWVGILVGAFFIYGFLMFLFGVLYDRRHANTTLARNHREIKELTAQNESKEEAIIGYEARLKGIVHLATTNLTVKEASKC